MSHFSKTKTVRQILFYRRT